MNRRIALGLGRITSIALALLGPGACSADMGSAPRAGDAQGKFWEYHDMLFANPQDLARPALERYAAEVGLNMPAFRHALDARLYAEDVDADVALGHSVQALARPSLYANGKPASIPYGITELTKVVETALAETSR